MKKTEIYHPEQQNRQNLEGGIFDPLIIFSLIKGNWYWFILSVLIALFCARLYIGHTMPVYLTSASILINEADERPTAENLELLQGLGLPGGVQNIQNQIMVLKSRALIESTLEELPFEIEFYFKTIRNLLPVYPEMPLRIISENKVPLPQDVEFVFNYLGNNLFSIESESDLHPIYKSASFGEIIDIEGGSFSIECRDIEWLGKNKDRKLCFIIHSTNRLINSYSSRLNVELNNREGSILKISLQGTNKAKDADFINKHIEKFQAISLNRKNTEAQRRIQFIDDQLVGITDSLQFAENRLQQFRSSHRVMDLSAQGQAIIGQVTLLENEKARLNLEANYYDYLADYLEKDLTGEVPIIPITMGINDPGLTRLVEELADLQGQLSLRGAGEMNPLQRNLEQKMRASKDALKETLNGLRRANSLARSENQEQINRANAQASALPVTERQLIGIERKFRLNDELYTFLLETRAEQEMQKASNRSDSEVIDPADTRFSSMISPNRQMVFVFGLFAGLALPLLIIILKFLLNKKLKDEDVRKITKIPSVGSIPHSAERSSTVVFDSPNSTLSESFRLLRSRMQFLTKEAKSPVILVTSTMTGDGKTFTAINLASVYSLLGKKTILVGFDLRKPRLIKEFNLKNESGVSTWLIGKDILPNIIQETSYENLSVIPAGPPPPNPSELTALGKTEELFTLLKERYDYIIVDTSPIGVVSDTFHLASLADACLLVVRPGWTLKDMLVNTLNEIAVSGIRGISLVINDIQLDSKHYGYAEKYGYTNNVKGPKKKLKNGRVHKQSL